MHVYIDMDIYMYMYIQTYIHTCIDAGWMSKPLRASSLAGLTGGGTHRLGAAGGICMYI